MITVYYGEPYYADAKKKELRANCKCLDALPEDLLEVCSAADLFSDAEDTLIEKVVWSEIASKRFLEQCQGVKKSLPDTAVWIFPIGQPKAAEEKQVGQVAKLEKLQKVSQARMEEAIRSYFSRKKLEMEPSLEVELLTRMNYADDEAVTMENVFLECRKLALLQRKLTNEDVERLVEENVATQIFRMSDWIFSGRPNSTDFVIRESERLAQERGFSALKTIGSLERTLRISCKRSLLQSAGIVTEAEQRKVLGIPRMPRQVSFEKAREGLLITADARRMVKTGDMREKAAFHVCILKLLELFQG